MKISWLILTSILSIHVTGFAQNNSIVITQVSDHSKSIVDQTGKENTAMVNVFRSNVSTFIKQNNPGSGTGNYALQNLVGSGTFNYKILKEGTGNTAVQDDISGFLPEEIFPVNMEWDDLKSNNGNKYGHFKNKGEINEKQKGKGQWSNFEGLEWLNFETSVLINQDGNFNEAYQFGQKYLTEINQNGSFNEAIQNQTDIDNKASVNQFGDSNYVNQFQQGIGNTVYSFQEGYNLIQNIWQQGDGHSISVSQSNPISGNFPSPINIRQQNEP